eukprot:gene14394-biopygen9601
MAPAPRIHDARTRTKNCQQHDMHHHSAMATCTCTRLQGVSVRHCDHLRGLHVGFYGRSAAEEGAGGQHQAIRRRRRCSHRFRWPAV